MSANQPPFPPYPDQRGHTAPSGPLQGSQGSQLFPPQLRMGQGQNTNPYGGAQNNGTPDSSFNDEATQAFQPQVPFPQGGVSPAGFAQPGAPMGQFQSGPSHFNQFNPSGIWNNGNSQPSEPTMVQPGLVSGPLGAPAGQFSSPTRQLSPSSGQFGATTRQLGNTGMLPGAGATGQLPGAYSGDTGMLTLNQAVKVVRIPVAGKPGEYKTGILPVMPQPSTGTLPPPAQGKSNKSHAKMFLLIALVLVLLVGTGSYLLLHASGSSTPPTAQQQNSQNGGQQKAGVNAAATANAQATATAVAQASLIVADPLSSPIRNWSQGTYNNIKYFFSGGAYHIRQDGKFLGYALMPAQQLPKNFTYTLTMQNVNYDKGNDNALSFYCMIFNYQSSNGRAAFYALRVNNGDQISYELDKFDNRHIGDNDNPWQQLYPDPNNSAGQGKGNGKEFKGPHQPNVYSVTSHNGTMTITVNGVKIGSVKDTSFTGGALGMGVNQSGTEAAFSNLSLSSN